MAKASTSTVDNIGRRKWDLSQFEVNAKQKQEQEDADAREARKRNAGQVVVREPLKQRTTELELYKQVGKYQVITNTTALSERGGYYCKHCECLLKDSNTWLDHINGKKHQRQLGMTMRPERATVTQVKKRLEEHKRRQEAAASGAEEGIDARIARLDEEAALSRRAKRKKAAEAAEAAQAADEDEGEEDAKAAKVDDDAADEDQDAMAAMGFAFSFGGSKKS